MNEELNYEIDEKILLLIKSFFSNEITIMITDCLALAANYGDDLIDSDMYDSIVGMDIDNSDMKSYIIDFVKKRISDVLKMMNIGLHPDTTLFTIYAILNSIDIAYHIEDTLAATVLDILENDQLSNIEMIARITSDIMSYEIGVVYDAIEYVGNTIIEKLQEALKLKVNNVELSTIINNDNVDDMFVLINNNTAIKHTRMFGLLYKNEPIENDIEKYTGAIIRKLDTAFEENGDYLSAALEIAAVTYVFRNLEENMSDVYSIYIEDVILDTYPIEVREKTSLLVKQQFDIIYKNMELVS